MLRYTVRRLIFAVPTLLVISFIIFALLDLAPSDPTANLPLTIPPEVREQIRQSLGLGQPFHIRYLYWLQQFFVNEPLNISMSSCHIREDKRLPRRLLLHARLHYHVHEPRGHPAGGGAALQRGI